MKTLFTILGLIVGICITQAGFGQDFFGAGNTGRVTYGFSAKYDGDFWVGTQVNFRKFAGPFTRPMDFGLKAEVKINKGIDNIAGEFGFGQVYGYNANTDLKGFGMGTTFGFRYEYCTLSNKMDGEDNSSYVSANLSIKPGYYSAAYSVTADINTDYFKMYLGDKNIGYKNEGDYDSNIDIRAFESLYAGAHFDWTNTGRIHLTVDAGNKFYLGVKHDMAWNTWKVDYEYDKEEAAEEATDDGVDGNCLMPKSNFNTRIGLNLRF